MEDNIETTQIWKQIYHKIQSFPLLEICPKEMKSEYEKIICTLLFTASQFTIAKYGINSGVCQLITKETVAYIHSGILFSHKNNEILSFSTKWIQLEIIMLIKIIQSPNHKCYLLFAETSKYTNTSYIYMNKIEVMTFDYYTTLIYLYSWGTLIFYLLLVELFESWPKFIK